MKHAQQSLVLILLCCSCVQLISNKDFCQDGPSSHIYLVLGTKGYISHENLPHTTQEEGANAQCQIQIITCSTCVIQLKISNLTQGRPAIEQAHDSMQIFEHKKLIQTYLFNNVSTYTDRLLRSETRYLTLSFSNWRSSEHTFSVEYKAERNVNYYQGVPGKQNITFGGTIQSPYFPSYFPRDIGVEYVISCLQSDVYCRVKLLFTDFLVPEDSLFQFFEWTGRKIRIRYGMMPRPPIIVSSGPSLLVKFFANGATGLGYKANYYFITGNPDEDKLFPTTDCGGEIDNVGGGITMHNMVEAREEKSFDCIWLIKPYKNYLANKLSLFLKVVTFHDFPSAELKIYNGQSSNGELMEVVNSTLRGTGVEHVVSGVSGFYISLQARFNSSSNLAISYATFSQRVCYLGPEFRCKNNKCIGRQLYCDGFDHCGDNSDEPDVCFKEWRSEPSDRTWYSHDIPNYYFPRVDRYINIKSATLIFTLSSIGLVFLIGGLMVLLYRMGIRARHQRERHSRMQTISDLFSDGEEVEVVVQDDPPNYEAPPSYDDATHPEKNSKKNSCQKCQRLEVNLPTPKTPDSPPPPYTCNSKNGECTSLVGRKGRNASDDPQPGCSSSGVKSYGPKPGNEPENTLASTIKQLYDFHILWNLFPRRVNNEKTRKIAQCNCEGACSCAADLNPKVDQAKLAATWSPATTKLEAIDLILNQFQSKIQAKNPNNPTPKRIRNLKGSASADNLFSMN